MPEKHVQIPENAGKAARYGLFEEREGNRFNGLYLRGRLFSG